MCVILQNQWIAFMFFLVTLNMNTGFKIWIITVKCLKNKEGLHLLN